MTNDHASHACCRCGNHANTAAAHGTPGPFTTSRRDFLRSVGGVAAGGAVLGLWQNAGAAPAPNASAQR